MQMKTKIFELKQAPVVIVQIGRGDSIHFEPGARITKGLEALGFRRFKCLANFTEEDFCFLVGEPTYLESPNIRLGPFYRDYVYPGVVTSATISFHTLLVSEKIHTKNPYGGRPACECRTAKDREGCEEQCYLWKKAQERTVDPRRTSVYVKKD